VTWRISGPTVGVPLPNWYAVFPIVAQLAFKLVCNNTGVRVFMRCIELNWKRMPWGGKETNRRWDDKQS
jgi:hypothetical protein